MLEIGGQHGHADPRSGYEAIPSVAPQTFIATLPECSLSTVGEPGNIGLQAINADRIAASSIV